MPTARRTTRKPAPASQSDIALSLALGELARRREGAADVSMDTLFILGTCEFDASCADIATDYNVARPAAVTARYITEWA